MISRALAPAKPIDLYIDDDRQYCEAIINDDDLNTAIGKGGMNINLASRLVGYRIDAFGKTEYEKQQKEQNTSLEDLSNISSIIIKKLKALGISSVSEMLNAEEENISGKDGLDKDSLEIVYDSIQNFLNEEEVSDETTVVGDIILDVDETVDEVIIEEKK